MRFAYLFTVLMAMIALQSCLKKEPVNEVSVDPFTYSHPYHFREVSIQSGNGDWTGIADGHLFTWLGNAPSLDEQLQLPGGSATYDDRTNLKTDFVLTIAKDGVFGYRLLDNELLFYDESKENFRSDLKGEIIIAMDTTVILHNTGVSPAVSIKYKLEE